MSTYSRGPGGLRRQCFDPARGVQELPKANDEPALECPNVHKRHVERLGRAPCDTAVAPQHHDLDAGIEELLRRHDELVPPVPIERIEDLATNLVDPAIGAAMGEPL